MGKYTTHKTHFKTQKGTPMCGAAKPTLFSLDWGAVDCGQCKRKRTAAPLPTRKWKAEPRLPVGG